jgi:hypothetical protein
MSSHSDADQLADRLDRVLPPHGPAVPEPTTEDPAVAIALRLARGPHPVLDAGAVARIGAHLLAAVDSQPARPRIAFRPSLGLMRWAAAVCLVLAVAIIGTATASARSLPGDTLYPVKRLVEQGQLALTSDGGEVTLRLDLAGRRLDEFESLLKRGEVRPETLDDAAEQMNSTLALVEDGAGTPDKAASQLIELSTREMRLAEEASARVNGDPAKAIELHEAVSEAAAVEQAARQLIAPPEKSSVRTIPDRFAARSAPQNLGRDTAVFIPHDSAPAAATVDAPTAVFVEQAAPQSPPSAPVVYRPPVVVPTSTPPAIDPGTPTPDGRPVADDPDEGLIPDDPTDPPGEDLTTPTADLPSTDLPGTPTDDRLVADDPDEGLVADDPTELPGDALATPMPDLPPADPPGTPTDEPLADDPTDLPGDNLATPVPDLPPTDLPSIPADTPTVGEENYPTENDLATPLPDLPPASEALTPPAVDLESPSGDVSATLAVDLPPTDVPGTPVPNDPPPALEAAPAVEPDSPPVDNPAVIPPPATVGNGLSGEMPVVVPQPDISSSGESDPALPVDPPLEDALTGD